MLPPAPSLARNVNREWDQIKFRVFDDNQRRGIGADLLGALK